MSNFTIHKPKQSPYLSFKFSTSNHQPLQKRREKVINNKVKFALTDHSITMHVDKKFKCHVQAARLKGYDHIPNKGRKNIYTV